MTKLAAALQENSAAARWQAIAKLNKTAGADLADADTLSALTQALADEHAFVRWHAGLALATQTSGRRKLTELLQNYPISPSETNSPSEKYKMDLMCATAVDALAHNQVPELYGYLLKFLTSGETMLRQCAAEALSRQSHKEALPYLTTALKDSEPWVRRAAALALGHLGDISAAAHLIACLKDKSVVVRRSAAYALGALRAEVAASALRISLTDGDPQVRRNAAWALGRMGCSAAIADLNRLQNDLALNGEVATAAIAAIGAISKPVWQRILSNLGKRWRG
jgi:HEAT repeat protein